MLNDALIEVYIMLYNALIEVYIMLYNALIEGHSHSGPQALPLSLQGVKI